MKKIGWWRSLRLLLLVHYSSATNSTDLIQRFVDKVLRWITGKFEGAIVSEIAQRLISATVEI